MSNPDYQYTPSFYNNEEFFSKYLGNTSYYLGLQKIVEKIISLTNPKRVLELGSALGTTSIMLAGKNPTIIFEGSDIREDVVKLANEASVSCSNVSFFTSDMCEIAKGALEKYDLIFLLYSFHHITDPLEQKIEFLRDCYRNMREGGFLLILETFLPEEIDTLEKEQAILDLWRQRAVEGYASSYWAALNDLTPDGIAFAKKVAEISCQEEREAGNLVYSRDEEYLVKFSWLKEQAELCGFRPIIAEPLNCIEEKVILLRK